MPFSRKLVADCVELINAELDSIPITCNEEFDVIAQELQNFITIQPPPPPSPQKKCILLTLKCFFRSAPEQQPLFPTAPEPLLSTSAQAASSRAAYNQLSAATKSQLTYVYYCLNNPKDFVALKENYAEYQEILKARITAKIIELRDFNEKQKKDYMAFQEEQRPVIGQKHG